MAMKIDIIPLLQDNYAYLLTDEGGMTAIIDPAEAAPLITLFEQNGVTPDYIINTHHHWDHTAGNLELKKKYGCNIIGPEADRYRIEGMDVGLKEGDVFKLGASEARIIETPGHTSGHICLYFENEKVLFCADTLFSMGCGRLFEGTAQEMWHSLSKLASLPDDTLIYCGHEYTETNGKFAMTVEPDNPDIQKRMQEVTEKRANNEPTIPVELRTEKKTNVFLKAGSAERFSVLRTLKDQS